MSVWKKRHPAGSNIAESINIMRTLPETTTRTKIRDQQLEFDQAGYLIETDAWDQDVAEHIASLEGIELTDDHWAVIYFVHEFHTSNGVAPDARFVFAYLAERSGVSKSAGRKRLFELFPYGYVQQVCKISGMRQPRAWSTG